jgi:hypothetical protein
MVTEHDEADEFEPWPAHIGDLVRAAIGQLLMVIIESTTEGSRQRQAAMVEALAAHERIRAAMRAQPTIN